MYISDGKAEFLCHNILSHMLIWGSGNISYDEHIFYFLNEHYKCLYKSHF